MEPLAFRPPPTFTTFQEQKRSLMAQIAAIGEHDPEKASRLSRQVALCNWSRREVQALRRLGLVIGHTPQFGLCGGGLTDVVVDAIASGIKIAIEGNKNEVTGDLERKIVQAEIQLPDGTLEKGNHHGGRLLSEPKKNFLGMNPKYHLVAAGKGEFNSDRVTYRGSFHNNAFHDNTGEAQYFIEHSLRYTGSFSNGKRTGFGRLEKYDPAKRRFYLCFEGTWQEDKPLDGMAYTADGKGKNLSQGEVVGETVVEAPPTAPSKTSAADHPLIKKKLADSNASFSLEESIALLVQCVQFGKAEAEKAKDRDAVIVIGNTGAGKSTLVNSLAGCTLELKSAKELGIKRLRPVIVVKPCSEGGALDEVMPIGHTNQSKTFMPQIETDGAGITYCDCPGFLDNRGAEINIANAVNIKNALSNAKSVRVIMLINYHSLEADRARGLTEMFKISGDLFGRPENLKNHQDSILIGITNVPLDQDLDTIREFVADSKLPIMRELSSRIFIYDPLDRDLTGGLKREQLLGQIQGLKPITNPRTIFSTVLTDADSQRLIAISEQIGQKIQKALKQKNFSLAAEHIAHLKQLSVIDHISLERLLNANRLHLEREFRDLISDFKSHCHFERFDEAQKLYEQFESCQNLFDEEIQSTFNLSQLMDYFDSSVARHEKAEQEKAAQQEQLRKANQQIEEFIALLDEQRKNTERQLQEQKEAFEQMIREMEQNLQETVSSYDVMKTELTKEMEMRLAQKEAEIKAVGESQDQIDQKLASEKEKLQTEYREKAESLEREKKAFVQNQQALKASRENELAAEKAKLEKKLQEIETAKLEKRQDQQTLNYPEMAFGPADWEKYFGEVDPPPPLPDNIEEILNSQCPYWPEKKVKDTHILFYVPSSVKRRKGFFSTSVSAIPLTLDNLGEWIQKPKAGRATKYRVYIDPIKKLHGSKPAVSHWALMTKDVIPGTRAISYTDQKALLKNSYEAPHLLDAAVGVFVCHAKTGEMLLGNSPITYTHCQEESVNTQIFFGSFASDGVCIGLYCWEEDKKGLCGLRSFNP